MTASHRHCLLLIVTLALGWSGCTGEEGIAAPRDQLFFPAGMAVDPAGDWLYITNANADLAYADGTLTALDLAKADELIAAAQVPGNAPPAYCRTSTLNPGTLLCDEAHTASTLLARAATVRIGNFAGELRVQPLPDGTRRLFTAVRGDPSVTWVDARVSAGAVTLDCSEGIETTQGLASSCDKAHRISSVFRAQVVGAEDDEEPAALPAEPLGLTLDHTLELGYVTHLSSGHVSLLDLRATNSEPRAIDFRAGFFTANSAGDLTAFAVQPRTPGDPQGFVYLTSRTSARVATFRVNAAAQPAPGQQRTGTRIVPGPTFDLPSQFVPSGTTADVRGIAFSHAGERGYLLTRSPAALLVVDTTIDPVTSAPRNRVLDSLEVCAQPSLLRLRETAAGLRAYVVCFAAGQVWVVDPASARVLDVIDTGRGPNAIELREQVGKPARAYVANFVDHTISVIELTPGAREHDVLLEIGQEID